MNRNKAAWLIAAGAALVLAWAPRAEASLIEYDFTATVTSGPLAPEAVDAFAYDSSSIVPGGANLATGLLTELSFTLNGITYDATTANTGGLVFNSAGDLTEALLGAIADRDFAVRLRTKMSGTSLGRSSRIAH